MLKFGTQYGSLIKSEFLCGTNCLNSLLHNIFKNYKTDICTERKYVQR